MIDMNKNIEVTDIISTLLKTKYLIVANMKDGIIGQNYWDNDLKLVQEIGRQINSIEDLGEES